MEKFKQHILKVLEKHGIKEPTLEIPKDNKFGDFAFPCFGLSKEMKKSPNMIAIDLSQKITSDSYIERVVATGPYINFFIKKEKLAKMTLQEINEEKQHYGHKKENHKKIMIEFSSPNTNKPLHLGHLRNIFLGESVSRIHEANGDKVIRACIVNDRGIHICKSMLAYQKWGHDKDPDKKGDHFVGDWYVRFAQEAEKDPKLEVEAQQMLLKYEKNDHEILALWKKMNKWVYEGFDETYKKIEIKFDKLYYESQLYGHGKELIQKNFENGVFQKDENQNIIAPLEQYKLPNKVVLRANGTTVYITQDIYLAQKKFEDYQLDKSIYVTGSEQNLHFQMLFKILDMLKLADEKKLMHLSYGMVNLPDGRMKSREGTVVDADDLIKEVENIAKEEIQKRYQELKESEINHRAHIITLAALKFFMLKHDHQKDMVYNPKESVSFEGETGPYLLYTYARIKSILQKSETRYKDFDESLFDEKEKQLIIMLSKYPEILKDAQNQDKPSLLARYLLDLAQAFNEYYHDHPILKAEEEVMKARLNLVSCISEVIKNGLNLLGINTLEQM